MDHTIIYGSADNTVLRLRYDPSWLDEVTDITLTITDRDGTILLAADDDVDFSADDTTAAALSTGDTSVTLTTGGPENGGAGIVYPGDVIRIYATGERAEDVTVAKYTSATKVILLDRELEYDHSTASTVAFRQASYSLDATDTTVWTLGLKCVLTWDVEMTDPDLADSIVTTVVDAAEVKRQIFHLPDFERRFEAVYPDLYRAGAVGTRLNVLRDYAQAEVFAQLNIEHKDLDKYMQPRELEGLVFDRVAYLIARGGGDSMVTERDAALASYAVKFEIMKQRILWEDSDGDAAEDTYENAIVNDIPIGRVY